MDAPVILSATPHGILKSGHMIPGETYVGILPGHTRPAFVRKRPVDAGRPPLLLTQIFGSSRRAYSVEASRKPSMFCRSRSDMYYDYATARYRPKLYVDQSPGRTITSTQQTCASCGKFRSARWQSRHPSIPGTASKPRLCGRCRDKHTSSEEERPRHRRRRNHHRHRDCTESTDDSYNTSRESRRAVRRHHSYIRGYRRRSPARSPSRENVRIMIANQAGDRICRNRTITRSSSMEPFRVIRRTEVVDLPERPPRTRSMQRSSSRAGYVDSATQYIDDFHPPRYLPRPRTLSRVSYIEDVEQPRYRSRSRSLSHATYVEELERPRYRSRPRSLSRVSHIEESDGPRPRRRARSSSQVRFVDETDGLVSIPQRRRLRRRRVVYFDGPADTEKSEEQIYSRTPSIHRSSRGASIDDGGAVLITETITPHPQASPKAMKQDQGVELIEEQVIPLRRSTSQSQEGADPVPGKGSDHYYRLPSETRSYGYKSDHDATPRPAFRHAQVNQSPDGVEKPSHHSSYIDFEGARSYRKSYSPALESREPSRQPMFTGSETPYGERRERVRESDESSGPDEDDYPRPTSMSYRHVEAPDPPAPHSDFLVEMLQNASITPPSASYTRGRPSERNHYSESDKPGRSYPRQSYPSEDSDVGYRRYGDRSMKGETLYGSPRFHEPEFRRNAEYDWMI